MRSKLIVGAACGLLLLAGFVWLLLWADARTQAFYRSMEDRAWE